MAASVSKSAYIAYRLFVIILKGLWGTLIYVLGVVLPILVEFIKTLFKVKIIWLGSITPSIGPISIGPIPLPPIIIPYFLIIVGILIIIIVLNFFPEITITTRYFLDFLLVGIIAVVKEFLNLLGELVGYLFSLLNYPIEVFRVFFFEIYDNLCKTGQTLFGCLGGNNLVWFFEKLFEVSIEYLKIFGAFTENLKIAMRDFICNQEFIYDGEEAGICFYETTVLVFRTVSPMKVI